MRHKYSLLNLKAMLWTRWLFGGPNGTTHDEQQYTPSDAITLIVEADGSTTAIGSQAEPMTAPALVSQQPPPFNAAPPAPAQGPEINFDYFHNQLAPFGTWVNVGGQHDVLASRRGHRRQSRLASLL